MAKTKKISKIFLIFFKVTLITAGLFLLRGGISKFLPSQVNLENCSEEKRNIFRECWERNFSLLIEKRGLNESLKTLDGLNKSNAKVASMCHVLIDYIGTVGYWEYWKNKFDPAPLMNLCYGGFYHGFMLEFASHEKDASKSKDICLYLEKSLGKGDDTIYYQCVVGAGVGLTYRYAVDYWGQAKQIFNHALADCKRIFGEIAECHLGVFSGMDHLYGGAHGYRLEMDLLHPFAICEGVEGAARATCVERMIPPLYQLMDEDMGKVARFIMSDIEEVNSGIAMERLAILEVEREYPFLNGFSSLVEKCKTSGNLRSSCIRGVGIGILGIGEPSVALNNAKNFCNYYALTPNEKKACLRSVNELGN